jgi:hypothetical protein
MISYLIQYTVFIVRSITNSASLILTVFREAPPTQQLEINATTIELDWTEGWKGNSPITRYVVEGNNETGFAHDKYSKWFDALIVNDPYRIYNLPPVIIRNLKPATVYRFRVKAENKVGSSSFSQRSGNEQTRDARKFL